MTALEDGRVRVVELHDVEGVQLREHALEHRRDDGEVLGDVVGDRERRQRAAGDQELLADLDDLDELRRVRVEVDHVPGFLGRLRAGVHGHADVGLGERGGVVGAVAGHGDEEPAGLLLLDQRHLVLGRGLGQEVVDAGLLGDGRRGERVVAGDHHRADAHAAQLGEPLADALLHDVLEVDHAEDLRCPRRPPAGFRRPGRCARRSGRARPGRCRPAPATHRFTESVAPLRSMRPSRFTPHMRVCAVNAMSSASCRSRPRRPKRSLASTTIDRPSGVSSARLDSWAASARALLVDAGQREELGRLTVAERDRAGLVEQQRVAVAGRLDRPTRHGQHVALHQPVHAGDADRRQQRTDRGRDEADQQRDQHGDALLGVGVDGERLQRHDGQQEDDRQAGQQDVEGDLVRGLLAAGALDERDHPVEERLARAST